MIVVIGFHKDLNADLDRLADTYAALGVQVLRVKCKTPDAVFLRDSFTWTPAGLLPCVMKNQPRQWEPEWISKHPMLQSYRWLPMQEVSGTYEGADLLWISPISALVAVGRRTDLVGAYHVGNILHRERVSWKIVPLPVAWHDQHLLGVANVYNTRIFSVAEYAVSNIPSAVLPQDEYALKNSNWVQVGNNIVINKCCTKTIELLRTEGANVIPVGIERLLEHGGGVACATGIVQP